MYAAFCPELSASRKMSPDAVSVSLTLMLTIGALKPGSVTKVCVSGLDILAAGGVPGTGSTSRPCAEEARRGVRDACPAVAAAAAAPPAAARQPIAIVNAAVDPVRPIRSLRLRPLSNLHPLDPLTVTWSA